MAIFGCSAGWAPSATKTRAGVGPTLTGPINRKRHPSAAPVHDVAADPRLDEGLRIFNEGHHWHAHEAWEPLWMGLEGDEKVRLQGLILAAAMRPQHGRRVAAGVRNHWRNVQERLASAPSPLWGVDVAGLLRDLQRYAQDAESGRWALDGTQVRIVRR